jgi:hypothetical protein
MNTAAANKIIELAKHIQRAASVGRGKRESRYLQDTRQKLIFRCAFQIIECSQKKTH